MATAQAKDARKATADFIERVKNGAKAAEPLCADEATIDAEYMENALGRSKPYPYPRELCEPPGPVGDLSRYVTETARCERPELSLAASIALWGALFGKHYESEEFSGNHTNFYVMAVAESSAGKDHPQRMIGRILHRANRDKACEADVTCDTAIEEALQEGWGVKLFMIDECGGFLKGASAANKNPAAGQTTILDCFKKLYSCAGGTYRSKRKSGKPMAYIHNAQVCFYGTTTPDKFAAGISPAEIEDGWTARCLVFMAEGILRGVDKGIKPYPEKLMAAIERFAPDESRQPPNPQIVRLSAAAKALYDRFDEEVYSLREKLQKQNHPLRALFGKIVEQAKKLGLLYAVSRTAYDSQPLPEVDEEAARWGCRLAWICYGNLFLFACDHVGGNEYAEAKSRIYRTIKAAGVGGITPREISRKCRDIEKEKRDKMLEDLVDTGDIVNETDGAADSRRAGRPPDGRYVAVCWTNPRVNGAAEFCPEVMGQNCDKIPLQAADS